MRWGVHEDAAWSAEPRLFLHCLVRQTGGASTQYVAQPPEPANADVVNQIEAARGLSDFLGNSLDRESRQHLAVGPIDHSHGDRVQCPSLTPVK